MTVLKRLPMDGTFNQTKSLTFLKGERVCYSYDLTSTTDRWPAIYNDTVLLWKGVGI